MECRACPHECGVDRSQETGVCRATDAIEMSIAQLHHWEEPPISGSRGSGTIFFSHCNLACRFCQNFRISQLGGGRAVDADELLAMMLRLQGDGAHNINLVTPTHYTEQLIPVLESVRPKLHVPVVWNSNGYEKPDVLRRLEGLVAIFLPDLKCHSPGLALECSAAPDYFKHASSAIIEMRRLAGPDRWNDDGTMASGLIIRHLVLPGHVDDTCRVLDWVTAELGSGTHISLMAQYYPAHRAGELEGMNRRLSVAEYRRALEHMESLGLDTGFTQELSSASGDFTPDFDR